MTRTERIWTFLNGPGAVWLFLTGESSALALAWTLRRFELDLDPLLFGQFQITSGLLALIIGVSALVRFRGTRDRLPLILACGFAIVGITLVSSSVVSPRIPDTDVSLRDPITWVIGRTFLAVLLVAALVVEQRLPKARNPGREIIAGLTIVVLSASVLSIVHGRLPADIVVHLGGAFPRPGNLFSATLFLLATVGYHRRLKHTTSPFDRSLYLTAGLNVACCLAASQSEHRLDTPFAFAEILQFSSYTVLLRGALLDNIRLFENVRQMAVSDPLTGLANYRRLVDALEGEVQRSRRTGRAFSLLLFDLDGLKKINDNYGHLEGSRALCRVANVLRVNSRTIDTAARYGGDEFALILPETGLNAAQEVARRICDRVVGDGELPPLSVSVGVSVFPRDGETLEALVGAADKALYETKSRIGRKLSVAV
ncbi:MAG: GGDEF domain-containing protein [Acidobacteriia bacterium]|nr:GGDEF domain-containing protein [Terriglobia bacterium]